jgi:hypothetical protein
VNNKWSERTDFDTVCRRAAGRRHYNAVRQFRAAYRRSQVARLLLKFDLGRGIQARIAAELGVSRSTVCRDLAAIMTYARPCPRCGRGLVWPEDA